MTQASTAGAGPQSGPRRYKYYDFIMAGFVTILLCSNLIGAAKVTTVGGFTFGTGILFFPISYVFGDVLTEVYGYARSRRVVWAGMVAIVFASFMSWVVLSFPPAEGWGNQAAYETVFGSTPRIVAGSIIAFFCGEFANSYTLAKIKIWMKGRYFFVRAIGSTVVGEAVDSLIFYPVAFLGVWSTSQVMTVMLTNYAIKVLWEVIAAPATTKIVAWLKRVEHEDFYDYETDFTPFSVKE